MSIDARRLTVGGSDVAAAAGTVSSFSCIGKGEMTDTPKRLSLSQIVEMLLTQTARDQSSVSLTRNASGVTLIEVKVRAAGDDGDTVTVEDAERKAREVYARLAADYPAPAKHDGSTVTLSRNAKGETQIEVAAKAGEHGAATIDETTGQALEAYDRARCAYPMANGLTAKPGSVA